MIFRCVFNRRHVVPPTSVDTWRPAIGIDITYGFVLDHFHPDPSLSFRTRLRLLPFRERHDPSLPLSLSLARSPDRLLIGVEVRWTCTSSTISSPRGSPDSHPSPTCSPTRRFSWARATVSSPRPVLSSTGCSCRAPAAKLVFRLRHRRQRNVLNSLAVAGVVEAKGGGRDRRR